MKPLQGITVVELAGIGPSPFCGMMLADMGADVIRVDRPSPVDIGLKRDPRADVLNRGKKSIAVDLKQAAGIETVLRLIGHADILLEGFRPGVTERLGLGPEACFARKKSLVYGRMTGWGQDGPLAQAAGHDINYVALSGALDAIGTTDSGPVPPLNLVGDFGGGGMLLTSGVLAALLAAGRTGEGQVVDAAMVEGASLLMASLYGLHGVGRWPGGRGENILDGGAPFYGTFETRDGKWIALGPIEAKFYREFLQKLEIDPASLPPQMSESDWPGVKAEFARRIKAENLAHWDRLFAGSDVCYAPVLSMAEAPDHPHNQARQNFVTIEGVRQPAPAPRFNGKIPPAPDKPPLAGENSRQVLSENGFSADEIEALLKADTVK